MATMEARPGSTDVEESPAAAVGRPFKGKNCRAEAPTGARPVKADWAAEAQREPPDREDEARRIR